MSLSHRLKHYVSPSDWRFLALAIFCIISVLSVVGVVLADSHRATEALAIHTSKSIIALVEQDISRNIQLLDLSLQGVQEGLGKKELMSLQPSILKSALFDYSASAEGLGSILVVNEKGEIVFSSQKDEPPKVNLSDRDYFQAQQASPDLGLFISAPLQSRVAAGEWSIGLSRRLNHDDGSFAGVVVGTMRLSYFQHVLSKVERGEQSSITLLSTDGLLLARLPVVEQKIGRQLPRDAKMYQIITKEADGSFEQPSFVDGVRRLYTFHKARGLPYVISVGFGIDEVFGDWRRKTWTISAALLALSGLIIILTLRVGSEFRTRKKAETELAHLVMTDALTGIANRRQFDERLAHEWARARRTNAVFSVLMIDVDYFKAFNDRFGHQAGDGALQAVATALQSVIKRPADLVARYGGEEFAALLPDTDEAGAQFIAEQMRLAVSSTDCMVGPKEKHKVSVSIGLGCLSPSKCDDPLKLVREADRALYLAKASGRNRVCTAQPALKLATSAVG